MAARRMSSSPLVIGIQDQLSSAGAGAGVAKLVKVDCEDLFLLLTTRHGFHDVYQSSWTWTALHRRPYSPPLETKKDRLVNMRNVCETFEVPGCDLARLESRGCKSIAHLALLSKSHLEGKSGVRR